MKNLFQVCLLASFTSPIIAMQDPKLDPNLFFFANTLNQNGLNKEGNTPLIEAIFAERDTIVYDLIGSGADVNIAARDGRTPLIIAAQNRYGKPMLEAIVKAGAFLEHRDQNGNTALLCASKNANPEAIRYLLDAGCNPHVVNDIGDNACILASQANFAVGWALETLQMLVKAGVNVNHRNVKRESALDAARKSDIVDKERVVALLERLQKKQI